MTASPTLDKVQVLQRTPYRAAKADPGRRFHALYDKVYRRDVLERAWVQVRRNVGAPGIDNQTIAMVEEDYGVARLLDELAMDTDLKAETYRPLAGAGLGLAFMGAVRQANDIAAPSERAALLAAFYVVTYVGEGLPVIGAGFLAARVGLVTGVSVVLVAIVAVCIVALSIFSLTDRQ